MATVTYSELHRQLEAQFKVRVGGDWVGCVSVGWDRSVLYVGCEWAGCVTRYFTAVTS
jgi:hypothetical protein